MIKTTTRLLAATAAAGLAFAPIAANANTRASDSSTVYSAPVSQPGQGRAAKGESLGLVSSGIIIAIFGAAAIIGGIILIEDDDDNQSPGGN